MELKHTQQTKERRRDRLEQMAEWLISGEFTRSTIVEMAMVRWGVCRSTAWRDLGHVRSKVIPERVPAEGKTEALANAIERAEAHLSRCIAAGDNHAAARMLIWLGELRGLRQMQNQQLVSVTADAAVVTSGNIPAEGINELRALFGLPELPAAQRADEKVH